MSGERGNEKPEMNIHRTDGAEHMPSVPASSQGAEVVKQIIEQILANERRRARMEFLRLSVFFLMFLVVIFGAGFWFARELIGQLRSERLLAEQSWRLAFGNVQNIPGAIAGSGAVPSGQPANPPEKASALNEETVAKLENNINSMNKLLKTNPSDSSSIQNVLASQQNVLKDLNAQLNEAHGGMSGAPDAANKVAGENNHPAFISAPLSGSVKLRLPIPSI